MKEAVIPFERLCELIKLHNMDKTFARFEFKNGYKQDYKHMEGVVTLEIDYEKKTFNILYDGRGQSMGLRHPADQSFSFYQLGKESIEYQKSIAKGIAQAIEFAEDDLFGKKTACG